MDEKDQAVVPCCPDLAPGQVCDKLDFHYRLIHNAIVGVANQRRVVSVEVIMHVTIERCSGPMTLGDIVYSNTLMPGEKVKLFTSDRRTRFSFDSATKVSYRNEQTSEEHFYMSSYSDFMSDLSIRDEAHSSNKSKGSSEGHGGTSGLLESIFSGPSVDVGGSFSAESSSDFLRELSQHAKSSHHRSEMGSRASSTVSIGEVQTRSHSEGETEDHFESASRQFANPNKCHAVTFFFYRINKTQTIKVTLESIERRVIDQAADTRVAINSFVSKGEVGVIPNAVLATDKQRLEVEAIGRTSVQEQARFVDVSGLRRANVGNLAVGFRGATFTDTAPLSAALRQQALGQIDQNLVKAGLLDRVGGVVAPEAQRKFSFEIQSSLPTPGVLVKGCLDDCNICEPELQEEMQIDLERKRLENKLLARKIELLDKAQEYRCCPEDADAEDE